VQRKERLLEIEGLKKITTKTKRGGEKEKCHVDGE
jgi:hypothetical protein